MTDNVVPMQAKRPEAVPPPVTDFWFAQVDERLGRVEGSLRHLEWYLLLLVCATGGLLLVEIVRAIAPRAF